MFLIDTNIFLEVMLALAKRKACIDFLASVKTGREKAAVTDFSVCSIMVTLVNLGRFREFDRFLRSLSGYKGLTLYAASLGIGWKLSNLQRIRNLILTTQFNTQALGASEPKP